MRTLDLRIAGVSALGAVLISKAPVKVDAVATALPSGAALEIVTGVVDEAGAVPSIEILKGRNISIRPGHYVRTRLGAGEVVGASNPLWVLAAEPKRPIPAVWLYREEEERTTGFEPATLTLAR